MLNIETLKLVIDIGIGLAAFRLAWSVDRTQKEMLKIQAQQANILTELSRRVESLEKAVNE